MTSVPLMKNDKLLEYLSIEVQKSLDSHEVYPLSSYAWQGESTPDDNYVGLAKWEVEPPGWSIGTYGATLSDEEKARLIAVETAGEDLRGLMEMSRLAIGHAILYSDLAKKSPFELHDPFWVHHLSAMAMLSMASERLRDVFLLGCFGQTAKEYIKQKPDNAKHFDHPFCNSGGLSCAPQFQRELTTLADLAKAIYNEGIDKRNKLVHERASELGKLAKAKEGKYLDTFGCTRKQSYEEARKAWADANTRHENEIDGATKSLLDWHKRLVKATSIVCDMEHTMRQ